MAERQMSQKDAGPETCSARKEKPGECRRSRKTGQSGRRCQHSRRLIRERYPAKEPLDNWLATSWRLAAEKQLRHEGLDRWRRKEVLLQQSARGSAAGKGRSGERVARRKYWEAKVNSPQKETAARARNQKTVFTVEQHPTSRGAISFTPWLQPGVLRPLKDRRTVSTVFLATVQTRNRWKRFKDRFL